MVKGLDNSTLLTLAGLRAGSAETRAGPGGLTQRAGERPLVPGGPAAAGSTPQRLSAQAPGRTPPGAGVSAWRGPPPLTEARLQQAAGHAGAPRGTYLNVLV